MFTEDALYVVLSRENADRGLPVGLIYCEGRGMIRDRAFALDKTAMFAPRYLRHIIGNLAVLGEEQDGDRPTLGPTMSCCRCCYDRPDATLHQVGVYHDVFRRVDGVLKLARAALRLRQPAGAERAVPAGLSETGAASRFNRRFRRGRARCWRQ